MAKGINNKKFSGNYKTGLDFYEQVGKAASNAILTGDTIELEKCTIIPFLLYWGIKEEDVANLEGLKQAKKAEYLPEIDTNMPKVKKGDMDAIATIIDYARFLRGESQDKSGRMSEFADYMGIIPVQENEGQTKAVAINANLNRFRKDSKKNDGQENDLEGVMAAD